MEKTNKNKNSELRQDLVTGDWVVVSKIRARRPDEFAKKEQDDTQDNPSECLFCDPEKSGQEKDVLIYNMFWQLFQFL